jgi:DNA-binding SARP family transcriptional activator
MTPRFGILGPLEVSDGDVRLDLATGRQRALLALLVVHANEPVSADRLIEALWAGAPPASAQKVLQGYVSQLRRVLPADTIVTRGSGYELRADDTDAREFEGLVERARGEDPAAAARSLRRALSLWRGRALADFEYEDWALGEADRLEELRLVALEDRLEADLGLGGGRRSCRSSSGSSPSTRCGSGCAASSCSLSTAPAARRRRSRPIVRAGASSTRSWA